MTTPIVVAVLAFLLLAGFIGWWVHWEWLAVWHWWIVGSEWRAERYGYRRPLLSRRLSVPADTIEDFPGRGITVADNWTVPAGEVCYCAETSSRNCPAHANPEPLSADEFDQLDPDTAAATLIAEWREPEWHAPAAESIVDTGTLGMFSDLRLLAWDAGRQRDKIQAMRDEWRRETVAPLLAWYQVQLDARRAA